VPAYLDHAATTPMRPEATEAMLPWLTERFGNASGGHAVARAARQAVEDARDELAAVLGCQPRELVFTSGGTEADNLAISGVEGRVACSSIEHPAVLEAVRARKGEVFDLGGPVPDADLVSVLLVDNDTGSIQSLDDVDAPLLHTDAVQALPWLDVAIHAARADLISVSAHKVGGPQGVGALVVREGVRLTPLLRGGGQERERRSGTHNVAGIVGFAAAVRACRASPPDVGHHRDRLLAGLSAVEGCRPTVDPGTTVAGILQLHLDGVESEALLVLLDRAGVCASAGASCASGAIGRRQVLRLSLGWTTTDADVDLALAVIPDAVAQLRR
jgi:cysteine desulfurase